MPVRHGRQRPRLTPAEARLLRNAELRAKRATSYRRAVVLSTHPTQVV